MEGEITEADRMHFTFQRMQQMGGGFASALAEAWFKADMGNKHRIERAFADLIEQYKNWPIPT